MTPGENLHEAVRSWSMDGSACHPRSCNTLEALSLNQSSDELFSHGNGSTALESFPLRMGYNARHHFLQKCRMIRRGWVGDRFGDNLCLDCANLLHVRGKNQFTNTKFTRPNTKISKSKN